ncbi:small integral membrane protein 14-like isoform X1 [Harpegnathos saltator]|uniref:small integral membrane protein 14-like isoform X1 n=1 Tax=Harpegnathos saltator TaxID=610380 RepID=UPI000DBEE297|nr:small integral membrane protein 14-like isoform X1 [Harpegnathos saltator]XP_025155236.1 small integral membrane protein 14-like isoform X1 [Harpegnathos saltator]
MSGKEFDPCECMQYHLSIQHLLSILRQSQDYCTDIECLNVSRLSEPQVVQESPICFLNICLILGAIIFMYALRPRSLQQLSNDIIKRNKNEPIYLCLQDSRHDPPSSPPPAH